jgi:hypothetical protein
MLSRIFRIILILDLDNPEVVRKITEWEVTCGPT